MVQPVQGWEFKDETGGGKRKYGYISSTPGSVLTIRVPVAGPDAGAQVLEKLKSLGPEEAARMRAEMQKGMTVNASGHLAFLRR